MHGDTHNAEPAPDRWTKLILARDDIARTEDAGSWVQFVPGRVVVDAALSADDSERGRAVRETLERAGGQRDDRHASTAKRLGLEVYSVDGDGKALPALVARLREIAPHAATLDHVLVADPQRFGGSTPPSPIPRPKDIPGRHGSAGKGLTVAVLDTGLDPSLGLAPVPLGADEIPDEDADQVLDPAAGHGTFITGVIRRYVPGAKVVTERVLRSPVGIASDLEVAEALLSLPPVDVINCSFGGPSLGDSPPLIIARALATLPPSTVVVACAGNEGEDRPHWPGAFKRVIAVASVEGGKGSEGWTPADYTNHGWWVDAAAPGTNVHSTFLEFAPFEHGARWSGTSFAAPKVTAAILLLASRDGIPVREAAYRLIDDPARQRVPGVGALVHPSHLPPAP